MCPQTPRRDQRHPAGRVVASVVIDLERLTGSDQRHATWAIRNQPPESWATVFVADYLPYDRGSHPDVPRFIADAVLAGVNVRFQGTPVAAGAWLEVLRELVDEATRPAERVLRRHLTVVGSR